MSSSEQTATTNHRIRRRPVTFGNPALGTYEGVVFTSPDQRNELKSLPNHEQLAVLDNVAAMVHVPPQQVPEGVLHFARAHRSRIEHMRILIDAGREETVDVMNNNANNNNNNSTTTAASTTTSSIPQAASTTATASTTTRHNIEAPYFQRPSSDDKVLPSPNASAAESAAAIFASDPPPINNNDDDISVRQQLLMESHHSDSHHDRTYLLLFVLSSPEMCKAFVEDLNRQPYTSLDETQVANVEYVVGLEGHDGVSLLSPVFCSTPADFASTTSSSRKDSISTSKSEDRHNNNSISTSKSEDTQGEIHNCAVCLEALSETGILTTVCNHSFHWSCLWQCQDSPCPVCRYDHAGLNEALSTCHVCGTTEHNYVCLICGVISCSSDNVSASSHAHAHYNETLHAYALDTETQHVWDFCGQGYVHRLLQNQKDGKLVEVQSSSQQHVHHRLPEAGRLSDAQEDEVVHRKLEGFAGQYYTLLKSQLEQQRIQYEGKLEELLRTTPRDDTQLLSAESLIGALKQERRQLQVRRNTLRDRKMKVSEEVSFLKNLNESLETNKEQMKHSVLEAQRERSEAREMLQQALPPLERRVYQLMLQLEAETNCTSSTKPAAK